METNTAFTKAHFAGEPKENTSSVVRIGPPEEEVPLRNPAGHPDVASINVQHDQVPKPGPARKQYVQSLCNFFQHPAVVISMARDALPRDVLEGIVAQVPMDPNVAAMDLGQQQVNVAQYVTEERERQVKAALMNALPKYLAYVNNELRLAALQSGSSLTLPRPGDGKVEVFARRMQALLNLRDMSVNDSRSLMDDWSEFFLSDKAVEGMVNTEMMREGRLVSRAVKESLPAYARASMWTEFDGSKGAASQAPRLAGGRFRRLWLLWMKHYESAESSQSLATALMLSFADVVQAHVASGNPASDVFGSESLAFTFDQTPKRFEGAFTPLVSSLWDALMVLNKECLDETKAVFIEEIRAAARRARLRKCCLWVSQSGIFWIILTMVGVGITVADQVTDVILGVEHVLDGNPAWAFLTFFLACLPSALQGSLMIPGTCIGRSLSCYGQCHSRIFKRLFQPCERQERRCRRGCCKVVWIFIMLVYIGLLFLLVTFPMWAPPITALVAISPFLGMLFVMKWGWLYFRQPDTRTVLEANLRSYSIMETLLESVPQLLLQLYIYSIQDELQRLRLVDVAAVSLSLLAIFKTVLIGDMEIHRNTTDGSARVPPLLVVTSLFRLLDVVVGVASAVTVAVYLRQHVIWFFLASAVAQASPISLNFGVCSFCYLFRCGLCCVTCCAGRASRYQTLACGKRNFKCADFFLFPVILIFLAFTPLLPLTFLSALAIPFCFFCLCRIKTFNDPAMRLFDWESANESAMRKLMPIVEPIFAIPANWVLSSGPSYMLLVRREAMYQKLSETDMCRQSEIACQSSVGFGKSTAPQLFPLVFTRLCSLVCGFTISYLIYSDVLHIDLAGTPLSEGYKMVSLIPLFGALPIAVLLVFWAWMDMSRCGKSMVGRCTRTDLLGRLLECFVNCCTRGGGGGNQIYPA